MSFVTETSQGRKRAYHHGDLRQALIDATLDVIAEENVNAVSLRAIARRVGVTYAAPYHHFKDKSELLAAVGEEGFEKMRLQLSKALELDASPLERFRSMGLAYVGFAVSHPAHYRVMFGPELRERESYPALHEAGDRCFARLIEVAASVLGARASEETVAAVALTAWSTVHGVSMLWNDGPLASKFDGDPLELAANVIDSSFAGLANLSS